MAHLLSAAATCLEEDWEHQFINILWLFSSTRLPTSSTFKYGMGKWLITALIRFTVQGVLWVPLQRFSFTCFPIWLLPSFKCPLGLRTTLPIFHGFSVVSSIRRCSVAQRSDGCKVMKDVVGALRQGHATYAAGSKVVGGKGRVGNEQELRCILFSVSCPGCQHHHPEIRTLPTHTYIRSATKYYGSGLDQTCGIQPLSLPHYCLCFPTRLLLRQL